MHAQVDKDLPLPEEVHADVERLINFFSKCLKCTFQHKVNSTDFIDDEFIDWKEKINPFSAAILLHNEHTRIEFINYYLDIRNSGRNTISFAERNPTYNTLCELGRSINLENTINYKIQGNLKSKIWNDAVKPYVGYTPLHLAVYNDLSEVVDILLSAEGINQDIKNDEGLTPLELAIMLENVKIAKKLLAHQKVNTNRNALIDLAIKSANININFTDALLQDPNIEQSIKDEILSELYKNPKLMFNAVRECNSNIINIFLENKGIDLNIKNDRDLTLLDFTIKSINQNCCNFTWLADTATKFALDPRSEFNEEQKIKLINANNKIVREFIMKPIIGLALVMTLCTLFSCLGIKYFSQLCNSAEIIPRVIGGFGMFFTPFTAMCALIILVMLCYLIPEFIHSTRITNQANADLEKSCQDKQNKLEQNVQDGEVEQDKPSNTIEALQELKQPIENSI
ncbi:ankyrin repeat domain-containing protein [Wolbachia endosymbiont of Folsomia candida]|uniref:ankyrin repeat domain-containing protein n=1 Tax=Wolbachia endosymbiont of Folsomia candida TaxID=169402 RepID=UPI000B320198|nr:ankyrin repeat domain-containing protein [Wolbachia endosymbiont of Folsomia candida]APR98533.1 hypothetical protein ASM33_04705 [Wolbachia endosymbiont of Folsomia candida]